MSFPVAKVARTASPLAGPSSRSLGMSSYFLYFSLILTSLFVIIDSPLRVDAVPRSRISSARYRPIVHSDDEDASGPVLPPPQLAPRGQRSLLPSVIDDVTDDIPIVVSNFLFAHFSDLCLILFLI